MGDRVVHVDKQLCEKLGRNDPALRRAGFRNCCMRSGDWDASTAITFQGMTPALTNDSGGSIGRRLSWVSAYPRRTLLAKLQQ